MDRGRTAAARRTWELRRTAAGQFQMPHMLCVDSRGAVYVAEVNGKRVQKFEPRGE